MPSSLAYAYGVNLLPAERVAEAVMRLNARHAQVVRVTGATFTLDDLDEQFQALFKQLEDEGICRRGVPVPLIITKAQWLRAQWAAIQRLARGEKL